jgi:hypothetical protein
VLQQQRQQRLLQANQCSEHQQSAAIQKILHLTHLIPVVGARAYEPTGPGFRQCMCSAV